MLLEKIETFLDSSIKACQEVQDLLLSSRTSDDFDVKEIGEGGDQSLLIDIKAEKIFFDHFLPTFALYSEEYGAKGEGDFRIILDPIDGSDNLVSEFPYYGASMALQFQENTIAAVVCNLVNGALFFRKDGEQPLQMSLTNTRPFPLIKNIHAKVGIFEKSSLYTDIIDKLMINKLKFRSPGAVALSLVYAYSARYMIFIGNERIFDIEAGLFIVDELPMYRDGNVIIVTHDQILLQKLKAIVLGE
ncbi:MAG: hypothetical protein OEW60_03610 [Thiovulaceae bacterium]|nr:hypothetical protein [Sulfurimonadaceae bacterium]